MPRARPELTGVEKDERSAPDAVERFEKDRKVLLSPDYKEEQLRAPYLTVRRSTFGVRTFLGPVIHEESIKVQRRPRWLDS